MSGSALFEGHSWTSKRRQGWHPFRDSSISYGWDAGEGAFLFGGRWSSPGVRVVYCSIDSATAILEVAIHKTVRILDTVPHVLTTLRVIDLTTIHMVGPAAIPNPNCLHPGIPRAGQQAFGGALLAAHPFVLIPSAVSTYSWSLLFDAVAAKGAYTLVRQERFALDTCLHPAPEWPLKAFPFPRQHDGIIG